MRLSITPTLLFAVFFFSIPLALSHAAAPTITSFTPESGLANDAVTIYGTGFDTATDVEFNGIEAVFTIEEDTIITATVPEGATTGAITVTNPDGVGTSSTSFFIGAILDSFSPSYGRTGNIVMLIGSNLDGVTNVEFNGTEATFELIDSDQINATVPSGVTPGLITIITDDNTFSSADSFFSIHSISSFLPVSGTTGTSVTITGSNFYGVSDVKFNQTTASFTVNSLTEITAVVPAGATAGPIRITNPGGTISSYSTFVLPPTITSFQPTTGVPGTRVAITGTNLNGTSAITFNGVSATTFTIQTPKAITVTVPAGSSTGVITVTNAAGSGSSSTDFSIPAPTIASFTPSTGTAGTSVALTGTNFLTATSVKFNGISAVFTKVSSTKITAKVPSGATSGFITVKNNAGTATSSSSFSIATASSPTVTGFSPSSGPVGASVSIAGANFSGVTGVSFNGVGATFTVSSSNLISATVPTGASTGPVAITTTNGTATSSSNFTVVSSSFPTITGFSPTAGNPGTVVSVTGTNFTGATQVTIGGKSSRFTILSSTLIQATVPTNSSSGAVTVKNATGTATSSGNFILGAAISAFTPPRAPVGARVTISGSNLSDATAVAFNGTAASFTITSARLIVAIVPEGATTGTVTVTSPAGTMTSSRSFTVLSPQISDLSPVLGAPGTKVTITGKNLSGAYSVKVNGKSANFSLNTSSKIKAVVPAGATTGPVSVTTVYGKATSSFDFVVTGGGVTMRDRDAEAQSGEAQPALIFVEANSGESRSVYVNIENGNRLEDDLLIGASIGGEEESDSFEMMTVKTGESIEIPVSIPAKSYPIRISFLSERTDVKARITGLAESPELTNGEPVTIESYLQNLAIALTSVQQIPDAFFLYQNYPNPFNPSTTISFDLPWEGDIVLTIYDILGRRVDQVLAGTRSAGLQSLLWNSESTRGILPSGCYFYEVIATNGVKSHITHMRGKMILAK